MPKPLTVWIIANCKILQEMGILNNLTCLLRNLYSGQEVTVRTGHGDFPDGPVIKTSSPNAGGECLIPGQGAKIPHTSWAENQDMEQKQHCDKFNKDLKKKKRTGHGSVDWFQVKKGVHPGYILSPCLYAECIMWNAGLDETHAGIKIAGRSINNLRYVDDTTLKAESKEKLESLDQSGRAKWKSWLKTQIQKTKIMTSDPITSW